MAEWVPLGKVLAISATKSSTSHVANHDALSYRSSNAIEVPKRVAGVITRYRRRVGHRSFIFQLWLFAWTIFYIIWVVSLLASLSSHAPAPPPGTIGFNPPPSRFSVEDLMAGTTSSMLGVCAGWAVVGLPVGIAAVATMENNRQ